MTDYTKTTDFTSKDSLPSGDSGKIIRGAEFGTEFDNIETAVNSKSNKENPSFTGNITVTGTVDGRDISADGTKLDTIETSADVTDTANVTAAGAVMDSELTDITAVKALNQGVATTDSPTFAAVTSTGNVTVGGTVDGRDVAADGTKLDTVETNADVTDTTNVTAAGALMDSEVTNLDQVKAFDSADYATAAQGTTADNALPKTGGAMTGAITTNSTFDGRDVATDGTKLDGIEALADVTDTVNVTAAGALMDSELTDIAAVKALNQGVATTDSPTFAGATVNGTVEFDGLSGTGAVTVTDILDQDDMSGNSATALATQQSIKSYVDSQVATSDTLAEVLANGNATGGTDVAFGDNDKALFGAGSDLQIYHDGSGSYIDDQGTGPIRIRSGVGGALRFQDLDGDDLINATSNGAVTLYHNNSAKLSTTSTGIDVTGSVSADGLTVDKASGALVTLNATNAGTPSNYITYSDAGGDTAYIGFISNSTDNLTVYNATATGDIELRTNALQRLNIDGATGDISFYEDTGTTAKLFWDAAAESLGIGTSSPSAKLSLQTATGANNTSYNIIDATTDNPTYKAQINLVREDSSGKLGWAFLTNNVGSPTERMRIDASGNVGIGTDSPDTLLHLSDTAGGAVIRLERNDTSIVSTDVYGEIQFEGQDASAGSAAGIRGKILGVAEGATGEMALAFQTASGYGSSTERMRIDSDGNVGIGSSSPAYALHVSGGATNIAAVFESTDADTWVSLIDSNTTNNSTVMLGVETDDMIFRAGGAEYMRLDSSGNVGIGTSSPAAKFHVDDGTGAALFVGLASNIYYRGLEHIWQSQNNTSERMRIDASGNLLVGKTGTGINTVGVEAKADGQLWATRDGNPVLSLNRETSDGSIAAFYKDGATVGSIGSALGDSSVSTLFIADAGNVGIRFDQASTDDIQPCTSAGANRDAAINLGASGNRFKDLYLSNEVIFGSSTGSIGVSGSYLAIGNASGLRFDDSLNRILPFNTETPTATNGTLDIGSSGGRFKDLYLAGGAYLGGTGSANKLDDYEEGTWTPTLLGTVTNPTTSSLTIQAATYTKVGRTVHVQAYIVANITNVGSGDAQIGGLPFNVGTGYTPAVFKHGDLIESNGGYFNNGANRIIAIADFTTNGKPYAGTGIRGIMISGTYEVA